MNEWVVYTRRSWTGKQVDGPWRFRTQQEAEKFAREKNRYCQDRTWNAPVAVVVNAREYQRA